MDEALLSCYPNRIFSRWFWCLLAGIFLIAGGRGFASDYRDFFEETIDFTQFSLEELKDVEITSASKKLQKLSEVSAAVFVITQEDIRRSGATTIAEVLRMAPGVQVARSSGNEWAVSIRGLNVILSNNLLVLVDGRSVYSPVFSGVFWDAQDTVLQDIDRIEIIRGPGATLWGANAVNGVINIITKKAYDTQGGLFTGIGGNEEYGATLRYGDQLGQDTWWRTYVKYFYRDGLAGGDTADPDYQSGSNWHSVRGGFRMDSEPNPSNFFTVQGDIYTNQYSTGVKRLSLYPPYSVMENESSKIAGGNILARWRRFVTRTADVVFQFYYDYEGGEHWMGGARVDTLDFDFQNRFTLPDRHEIIWGIGYRFIADDFAQNPETEMIPGHLTQNLFSAFIQDEIQIFPNVLEFTFGSKFEHNKHTGLEIQPNARFIWTPKERHTVWGAISRAVRMPSRFEQNVKTNEVVFPPEALFPDVSTVRIYGNENLEAEELIAYELGYRIQPINALWIDMAVFFNDYERLISYDVGEIFVEDTPKSHYVIPLYPYNNMKGKSYGFELSSDWQVTGRWQLKSAYTYLETQLHPNNLPVEDEQILSLESSPRHQFSLNSYLNITERLELDLWFRYVDNLPDIDIDSYNTLNARLSWKPTENLELSVVEQNLLGNRHPEFSSYEVEGSVYFKLNWQF